MEVDGPVTRPRLLDSAMPESIQRGLGDMQDSFCLIELGFGHLRLSGPYAFGNTTRGRVEW